MELQLQVTVGYKEMTTEQNIETAKTTSQNGKRLAVQVLVMNRHFLMMMYKIFDSTNRW